MDSLTQIALGSAVGIAAMGRRTAVWKSALWGAVFGTLPDLDSFINHGDPISNMTFHRAHSHALFWLTLAAPVLAGLVARLHGEVALYKRWWLAVWLILVTHPLLDTMTVYGTQLAQPFSDHPFAVGSVFIIDPLYTVPLLVGVIAAWRLGPARGLRWNVAGLLVSSAYLAWSLLAQQWVRASAEASLQAQGVTVERLLVTPTAFNTVLWRVVAITPDGYHEGFRSLLDRGDAMQFERFERGEGLHRSLQGRWPVDRMAWFTHGFFKVSREGPLWLITDLRMGQEPHYTFSFVVAREPGRQPAAIVNAGRRPEIGPGLRWLWRRAGGELVPPPH